MAATTSSETVSAPTGGLYRGVTAAASTPSASDTYAAITRDMWAQYVNVFQPIENQLISYATDDSRPLAEGQAAGQNVLNTYAQQGASEQRRLQSLGITMSPQEKAASDRVLDNSRALATVQGANLAMDLTRQRQMGILGNPAPTTGSIASAASGLQT